MSRGGSNVHGRRIHLDRRRNLMVDRPVQKTGISALSRFSLPRRMIPLIVAQSQGPSSREGNPIRRDDIEVSNVFERALGK